MSSSFFVPVARLGSSRRLLEGCGIEYRAKVSSKANRTGVIITVRKADSEFASRLLGTRKR